MGLLFHVSDHVFTFIFVHNFFLFFEFGFVKYGNIDLTVLFNIKADLNETMKKIKEIFWKKNWN